MAQINCDDDPIACLRDMFVSVTQKSRLLAGQSPARRPVFLKAHGVAAGTFIVRPDLPAAYRVGVFGYDQLPAWVRFSSDTLPGLTDKGATAGIGIKLWGINGEKMLPTEEDAVTQDFILQNYPVFFVSNALEMCRFTKAGVIDHDYDLYLKDHPETDQILQSMSRPVPGVLETDYYSALPYAFGPDQYVKYLIRPAAAVVSPIPNNNPNYLADQLKQVLLAGPVTLDFFVQLRTDPDKMPLDDAMVRWDEEVSRPVPVASLVLRQQNIGSPGQDSYGENLSFQPWHSLPEHTPVGSINEARKSVYKAAADLRRNFNGIPIGESANPRSL